MPTAPRDVSVVRRRDRAVCHQGKLVGIEDNLRTIVESLFHEGAGKGAAGGPIDLQVVMNKPGSERSRMWMMNR